MTSRTIKVYVTELEKSIHRKMLATGDMVVNGITINYRLYVEVGTAQAKICMYVKPQTCEVFPSITLKSEFGFENRNGNMCRIKTHKHDFVHSDTQFYGASFLFRKQRRIL